LADVTATERLERMFVQFAEHEFRDISPRYRALARACADDPALDEPLLTAPPRQRRALLLFAAAQYLLRTVATGHPLAAYLPVLGGDRPVDAGLVPAFADLVHAYPAQLRELCAGRTTQTNEAARAALLRPAFGRAWLARRPGVEGLGLVELGTSAGLLLLPDRYGYRYVAEGGAARRYGRADAPDALVHECALRDPAPAGWPATGWPEVAAEPAIASRAGIDLNPADADDPDAVAWLRSCIWPEQVDRLLRLDAALAEVRVTRPRLVRGDMVDSVATVLSTVEANALPVVFTCHAVTYLPRAEQQRLVAALDEVGRRRDLAVVLNESADAGCGLFAADAPPLRPGPAVALLTLVSWLEGRASVEVLGATGPHGSWIGWHPRRYAFRRPSTAG
jgi:hypothetical protein